MTPQPNGPEGVEVDYEARTLTVCGVPMVVGNLSRHPYEPEHMRCRADYSQAMVDLLEEMSPSFDFDRPVKESPEVVHANLLCGENGWWVELAVCYDAGPYAAGLTVGFPDEPIDPDADVTAEQVLASWRLGCLRTDPPPSDPTEPGPFGGGPPGHWDWIDG